MQSTRLTIALVLLCGGILPADAEPTSLEREQPTTPGPDPHDRGPSEEHRERVENARRFLRGQFRQLRRAFPRLRKDPLVAAIERAFMVELDALAARSYDDARPTTFVLPGPAREIREQEGKVAIPVGDRRHVVQQQSDRPLHLLYQPITAAPLSISHVLMALRGLNQTGADAVILRPAGAQTGKKVEHWQGRRFLDVQTFFAALGLPQIVVSPDALGRNVPGEEAFAEVVERNPEAFLGYVTGGDHDNVFDPRWLQERERQLRQQIQEARDELSGAGRNRPRIVSRIRRLGKQLQALRSPTRPVFRSVAEAQEAARQGRPFDVVGTLSLYQATHPASRIGVVIFERGTTPRTRNAVAPGVKAIRTTSGLDTLPGVDISSSAVRAALLGQGPMQHLAFAPLLILQWLAADENAPPIAIHGSIRETLRRSTRGIFRVHRPGRADAGRIALHRSGEHTYRLEGDTTRRALRIQRSPVSRSGRSPGR